jgi:hypothetical protein
VCVCACHIYDDLGRIFFYIFVAFFAAAIWPSDEEKSTLSDADANKNKRFNVSH